MPPKQHNPVIDMLRFIAILAVLLVHTTTRTMEASSFDLQKIPWTLFLNQASRFAVPLFFMISGFVLELSHPFNSNYLTYVKKRINRIFIPYLFWSVIYYFFIYYQHRDQNFLNTLLTGDASYQLYFIPALIIFYLIFPLIHKYYDIICNKWSLVLLCLLQLFILYWDYYIHPLPFYYPISIALLNFFYFVFGVALSRNQEKLINFIKKWKIFLFSGSIVLALYIFFQGFYGFINTHNYLVFYSQWRPSVLIYTFFIGGFLYWVFDRKLSNSIFFKTLSRLSFFVFFIHVIILEQLWYWGFKSIFSEKFVAQLWFDPVFFLSVAGVSFGLAFIAHKIPYLSKITG